MSDDDDVVTRAARKLAERLPKQSDEQKAQNDAYVTRARLAAEQFAAPKVFAMKQNIAQNMPMAQTIADAILKAARPAPKDLGDLEAPRQPIQMEREFPATPQGEADKAEYIRQRAQEAARKAAQVK
jgi:hypothetical protein